MLIATMTWLPCVCSAGLCRAVLAMRVRPVQPGSFSQAGEDGLARNSAKCDGVDAVALRRRGLGPGGGLGLRLHGRASSGRLALGLGRGGSRITLGDLAGWLRRVLEIEIGGRGE